jgi:hypothetical protein
MAILSEQEIIEKINNRETFNASIDGNGFSIKIDRYEPALCAAIHNGGNIRSELAENCLLEQSERYYEEDPFTGSFIAQQAITMIGNDSRYEYDLNRNTDECVYETAWGKDIWKEPLTDDAIAQSKSKHAQFFRVVSSLVEALVKDFGQCVVYDIHSYNFRRHEREDLPVFNLGTSTVKSEKWRPIIDNWLEALQNMKVEGVNVTAAENDIFFGKGNLAGHCHGLYDDVLVLATEVKKVFMDELRGEADETVLPSLEKAFNATVADSIASNKKVHK